MEHTNIPPVANASARKSKRNPSLIPMKMNAKIILLKERKIKNGMTDARNRLQSAGIEVAIKPNQSGLSNLMAQPQNLLPPLRLPARPIKNDVDAQRNP